MAYNGWYKLEQERTGKEKPKAQKNGIQNKGGTLPPGYRGTQAGSARLQMPAKPDGAVAKPKEAAPQSKAASPRPAAQQPRPNAGRSQLQPQPVPQPQPIPHPQPMPQPIPQPIPQPPLPTSKEHSLTVGKEGPVLQQDLWLHETLGEFVGSTVLKRVVHTKGCGAMGFFQCTNSMAQYTTASIFQTTGKQIPVTTRFSLAVSNEGTPDTGRNVRGFATKFYTEEGIFDLLCNQIPVFLVQDAIRFPESIAAFLPDPKTNIPNPERFWGFIARSPEAVHFVTWLYSDVGTLRSFRQMSGHSVNTYIWKNAQGQRRYVKYHWIPQAGEAFIDRQESVRLAGENPNIAAIDLYSSIAQGQPAIYALWVQLMNPDDANKLYYDPLDDTKVWDEDEYPLIPVGRLSLNRNPDQYPEQVEKVAFSPSNLIGGMELSADKMLQGRATVYWDAQRHRLGNDFRSLPINQESEFNPSKLVSSMQGEEVSGKVQRSASSKVDYFSQAGERYRKMSAEQQARMVDNIASELYLVSPKTQGTVLSYFEQASPDFAQRVRKEMEDYAASRQRTM